MLTTSCLRLAVSCLLGVLAVSGCYRKNQQYCDQSNPCKAGYTCHENECDPTSTPPDGSVVDMAATPEDMAMTVSHDMSLADLRMPPPDLSMQQPDMARECSVDTECAAKSATPACVNGKCVPCTRNFQCPNSACDDDNAGVCHPQSKVLVVSDATGCRTMGTAGSAPYCSVTDALVDPGLGATYDVLLIKPSTTGGYDKDGYILPISASIRLVGARTKASDPAPLEISPLEIKHGTAAIQVGIEDLHLRTNMSGMVHAVFCHRSDPGDSGINLSVRWSEIESAPNYGIYSTACGPVRLIGNYLHGNGAAADLIGPTTAQPLIMVDNFAVGNNPASGGTNFKPAGAVTIQTFGTTGSVIAFNTLWNNACPTTVNTSCNLSCAAAGLPPISYSLVGDPGGGAHGIAAACTVTNSVVPANYSGGASNQTLTPDFVSATDYHIKADAANAKLRVAAPMSLPYPYDIDFDARPQATGVDIGADQLVP